MSVPTKDRYFADRGANAGVELFKPDNKPAKKGPCLNEGDRIRAYLLRIDRTTKPK